MSFFETVDMLPEDPIMGIPALFKACKIEKKVNLGIGAYHDAEGRPFVLNSVKKAETIILNSDSKEYLPITGNPDYLSETLKLLYGDRAAILTNNEVFAAQTVGGSGALRLGAEFLAQECSRKIFNSNPSWPNHKGIFGRTGLNLNTYPYYDEKSKKIDFEALCNGIKKMPPGSVILLQPCCHNPTGMDLSFEQWKVLSDLIKTFQLFPFFDSAYQGFSEGLEQDVRPIRYFVEQGHQLMVAQSFSKNFGLYGERVGVLSILTKNAESAKKLGSHIKLLIRQSYSNPPIHGAKIIATILQNSDLRKMWEEELQQIKGRIREMRLCLMQGLTKKCPSQDFTFLSNQRGMFSFSGLREDQVIKLRDEFGIYMLLNGRMNVAGLNPNNMNYVIESMAQVL